MTWLEHHRKSEELASGADVARLKGDTEEAKRLYGRAADAEVRAIEVLDPSKRRTLGITAVSAVALHYKAANLLLAEKTAYRLLNLDDLPGFARMQIRDLLHAIWADQHDKSEVEDFLSDQVNVAMLGDDILMGGAPIDVVLRCVRIVQSMLYRVTEFIQGIDHRAAGQPSSSVRSACRPWIMHVPTADYQFAVTIDDTVGQLDLFGDSGPRRIVDNFIAILRASVDSPEEELRSVVPAYDYQHTFLGLTRQLSPDESHRLSVWSPRHPKHISLDHSTRTRIRAAMKNATPQPTGPQAVKGVLRAVDLDRGRIVVRDRHGKYNVDGIDDTMDDVIGTMINRQVTVSTEPTSASKLLYKTIEVSDNKEAATDEETLNLF